MFQHANEVKDILQSLLVDLVGDKLEVVLAHEDATIYFTKTHLVDLRAIVDG